MTQATFGPSGRIMGDPVVLTARGTTRSASADDSPVPSGPYSTLRLTLEVTDATGTLDVTVETSPDASTWTTVDSFTQATGTGSEHKVFTGLDRFVRASSTIGTGPFTYGVTGVAV